jgi:DNA-binding HxlR family transcriptional regulator
MIEEENMGWMALREIYKLVGSEDGGKIVRVLLNHGETRSSTLMATAGLPQARFYAMMKALELCDIVERDVHKDRSVHYKLAPFGQHVLKLSEPLIQKIQQEFKGKESTLLEAVQK